MICMIEYNNTNCCNKLKKKKKTDGRSGSGTLLKNITGFPLEGVDPVTEIWK